MIGARISFKEGGLHSEGVIIDKIKIAASIGDFAIDAYLVLVKVDVTITVAPDEIITFKY